MAFVEVSPEQNLSSIVAIAGGSMSSALYRDGGIQVDGVSQEDLEAALATYMSNLEAYLLQPARESKNNTISQQANFYIEGYYPSFRRELFIALAEEARNTGLTNRLNYINQLLTWVKTVVALVISAETALESETTLDDIQNYSVDFSVFDATNPNITVKGALAIED